MQSVALRPREARRKSPPALRTHVLNADYRPLSTYPLSIIAVQDALSAIWRERVDVVEAWPDAFFRSPSTTIAVPKIVVLRHYAPVSGEPKFCRRSILLRVRFKCCYCSEPFSSPDLTYDHVIPRSLGGKTEWTNIVTARRIQACFQIRCAANNLPQIVRSRLSNSMLGSGRTTPQHYRE
jgi:5-methylcytosine-specific restriction endonuclease McrA